MIIIEGLQKYAWIRSVTACFVCVGLNLLFIPKWGLIGTAIASILTYLYAGTISNIFIPQYWFVLKTQIKALFLGWKDLIKLKQLLQS
jgi:O-antigen/teichoic acid export membrane protein